MKIFGFHWILTKIKKMYEFHMIIMKIIKIQVFELRNIESMKKILKSHRAALDFDRAFVVTSIKTLDVAFDWQKELGDCETMTNKKRKRIK